MKSKAQPSPPVGPPMKPREGIEFLVALADLNLSELSTAGQPENIADLGHVVGVLYELCRFTQTARDWFDGHVAQVVKEPEWLKPAVEKVRDLIGKVADGRDFAMPLELETSIRISGRQFHRAQFRSPLPFAISSPTFLQGIVVTAIFYLGLTRDSCLIRRCKEPKCGKLFMAIRQSRRFCSHECASAASVRAFRERQKVQEA
jgi:CGNR zinc finger